MNKTVLITGASRGIGKACAELFLAHGYAVLSPGRNELDLLSEKSIRDYIANLKQPVDILINNAGINPLGVIGEIDFKNAYQLMETNFWAPVLLTDLLAPKMKDRGYGRIVNISSIWSGVTKAGRAMYASSKAAINAFTRTAAVEYASSNVLVNAVAPGYVNTELTKINNTAEQIETIKSNLPINRLAEPSEIAELVYFLASDKNTFVTGQTIF
ncbi:MAG: SDR family oxidoreductase, partial [Bacteroidetes bacterium]|nr:SDR family oxidoreductase [Bacteroidota bacterium]